MDQIYVPHVSSTFRGADRLQNLSIIGNEFVMMQLSYRLHTYEAIICVGVLLNEASCQRILTLILTGKMLQAIIGCSLVMMTLQRGGPLYGTP